MNPYPFLNRFKLGAGSFGCAVDRKRRESFHAGSKVDAGACRVVGCLELTLPGDCGLDNLDK
jgi:hypothetical protein